MLYKAFTAFFLELATYFRPIFYTYIHTYIHTTLKQCEPSFIKQCTENNKKYRKYIYEFCNYNKNNNIISSNI